MTLFVFRLGCKDWSAGTLSAVPRWLHDERSICSRTGENAEPVRAFRFGGWELNLRLSCLVAANGERTLRGRDST